MNKRQSSMISIWTFLLLAGGIQHVLVSADTENTALNSEQQQSQDSTSSPPFPDMPILGPLHLTPYINECEYDKAKEISQVKLFKDIANATAYSGYITVNSTTKSHIFFLFIVAEGNNSNEPFLLWTQGGPGLSALFGQFLQNGPVAFHLPMNLKRRTNTLHKTMNLLYLDVPIGAGFSYTEATESQDGYSKSLEDITKDITEFLGQFFQLFFEYKNRDFYFAGESYGARYSVAVAHYLLGASHLPLTVKGVIGGNGFLGPIWETAESSDFLYQASMLTEQGRETFKSAFINTTALLGSQKPKEALLLLFSTIFADITQAQRTLFQNLTLYNDHASPLYTERPLVMLTCYSFLSDPQMKVALHAGMNNTFEYNNKIMQHNFAADWLRVISDMTEHVLNNTRVLLYTGQLDALFPSVNQRTYFAKLKWKYADQYKTSKRCMWKSPTPVYGSAGYLKQSGNFSEAIVFGMSHYGAVDKPDEVWYLISEFVQEKLSCSSVLQSQGEMKEN